LFTFRSDISALIRRKSHIGTTVEEKINKIRTEKDFDEIKKEEGDDELDPSDEEDSDEQVNLFAKPLFPCSIRKII
jgi:hypothetical protein